MGGKMRFSGIILTAAILSMPLQATAELAIGGWVGVEADGGTSTYGTHYRTDTLVSYNANDFVVGVGVFNLWTKSNSGVSSNPVLPYFLFGYGDAVLSFGPIYGAGNLFPEDYFGFDDTTSQSDQVVRLDFSIGEHNFAISNDLNGSSASEIELGYAGILHNYDVAFGYEADSAQLALLVGRDFGNWGFQVASVQDTSIAVGPWDHAGVTLFRDFDNGLTIAANITHGTNGTVGLHSYGVNLIYDAGIALI
jgi:hypothetical protein